MWNQIFKECTGFWPWYRRYSFQYLQYQPTHKILGIDASKVGIQFATETARLSDYKTAAFEYPWQEGMNRLFVYQSL